MQRTVPFRLGDFDCQQRLGGNYGEVYFAMDLRTQQPVLVKLMQPFGQTEMFRQRFLVEARVACQCVHESLIQTYAAGEIGGQYALVMEIPQGDTLRTAMDRGEFESEEDALGLGYQIAHAMAFLHGFGVVHRDLKPENIIVYPDRKIKLFDFGAARLTESKMPADNVSGTPLYMAPEQVRGEPPSPLSDIYAFGVVLFHLLTRAYPYKLAAQEDLYNAIVHRDVNLEPLAKRGLRNSHVPEMIAACLRKDPAQRPQSFDWIENYLRQFGPAEAAHHTAAMLRAMALPPPVPGAGPKLFASMQTPVASPPPPPGFPSGSSPSGSAPSGSRFAPGPSVSGGRSVSAMARAPKQRNWMGLVVVVLFICATAGLGWILWPKLAPLALRGGAAAFPGSGITTVSMQKVPQGRAFLGRDHEVMQVPAFEIDQTEVPNHDYLRFCKSTRRPVPAGLDDIDPQLPVVNVSYEDAKAFAKWAGKRLPTGIEWEKAARGEDGRKFPWGNEPLLERANVGNTGYVARVNARGDGASPYGVLNLVGNVWEWVDQPVRLAPEDFQRLQHMFTPPLDINEPSYQIRGGSYMHAATAQTFEELVWDYAVVPGRTKRKDIGFRCARDAK